MEKVGLRVLSTPLNDAGLVSFYIFEEPWLMCGLNVGESREKSGRGVKYSEARRSSLGTG